MSRFPFNSRCSVALVFLLHSIFLSSIPGTLSSGVVTLNSIQIFKTHEWLSSKPIVYFRCQGKNKTILPDVKKTHHLYTFKGEESWQPLTELADRKCKRCGFYEQDTLKSDDIFDEWEFCPSDFTAPTGNYTRFKEDEFNATFSCPRCVPLEPDHASGSHDKGSKKKKTHVGLAIVVSALVVTASVVGATVGYKYWQKKKREHDQARFLKLFEDSDDIEDDLGLGNMI